ncbi:uncharacterized protein GGS22DRAFT_196794 [Annulohypoxylon maeteangense]|uniref:uncharacterized protein n=1 Tax=Annulohypoxylon maeteangense TaxID=1927788 RepID=UPI002008C6EC|nr:uncharacterized protein GGS22DRAFT_196794 [Annulohypoxylon maeteangense]KAI0889118.1 hypothetical protein GGS22DRAFT_196794 [Annulohypoxylon maeteangense]
MEQPPQPTPSPFHGRIKVYDTLDGSDVHWTQPRRVHLHRRTPSGDTLCCASVTIGGLVEDANLYLLGLTSDRLVPESETQIEEHTDTNDGNCVCVGFVKHTSRNLHYTLINISLDMNNMDPIQDGTDYISTASSYKATLHPVLVRQQHMKADLVVMTRTRNQEVMTGRIISLPTKVARPAYVGTGELMVASFDPSRGRVPSNIDVGTWVYVKKPDSGNNPRTNGIRELHHLVDGTSYVGVFETGDEDYYIGSHYIPVVLLGHIVEVCDNGDREASVRVTIQGAYEVLTEMFVRRGGPDYPDGIVRGPAGTDTL